MKEFNRWVFNNAILPAVYFENGKKSKPTDADYTGSAQIGGYSYWVNGWVKTSANSGKKYLSLSLRSKQVAEEHRRQDDDVIDF